MRPGVVLLKALVGDQSSRAHIVSSIAQFRFSGYVTGRGTAVFGIGPSELLVILVIALLVLGPKRLPELARSLGKAMGEFRRATADITTELDNARIMLEEESRAAARAEQ